jgi:ABC-type dipeptide/oligopeptide/nickel transport system permease subunit
MVLAALFATWLAPRDPIRGDLKHAYLTPPGSAFLLGADTQGRDVLSRVLYGAESRSRLASSPRVSRFCSGCFSDWSPETMVGGSMRSSLLVVFVIVGWAAMARLVRSQVLVLRNAEYIQAARAVARSLLGSFAPGLAIGIAVLGFNLVGEGLREAWDPKLGER